MKISIKHGILAAGAVMAAFFVAACGEKSAGNDSGPTTVNDTYVVNHAYAYTQEQINITGDVQADSLRVEGMRVYYSQTGDGLETGDCFFCLDLENPETEPLCLYEAEDDGTAGEGFEKNTVKMFSNQTGEVIVITQKAPVMDEETASEADWRKWFAECSYVMEKVTEDGEAAFSVDITEYVLSDEEAPYLQHAFADGEGRLFLTNGISSVWIFDGDGRYLHTVKLQDNLKLGMFFKFGTLGDGRAVIGTDTDEGTSMNFVAYDAAKQDFTEVYTNLPGNLWATKMTKGPNGGTLCYGSETLYEYDCQTQTYMKILNWKECGIEGESVQYAAALQNGNIIVLCDGKNGQKEWMLLKKETADTEKTVLTMARVVQDWEAFHSWQLEEEVINFNLESKQYRIEVREYRDAEAFYYDILTGNIPDMFDSEGINMRMLAAKGIIEDMNPYLENSSTVKRQDLFESVLDAYTIDGVLCTIPNTFWIETLFGKSSEVGEHTGWTFEEMFALVNEYEDKSLFAYEDRELILYFFIQYNSDAFVDWENGRCYFDTEEFQEVLELASRYGEYEGGVSEPQALAEGKALLCRKLVSDPVDISLIEAVFGEPVTPIGFPGDSGRIVVQGIDKVCICAGADNKEGAWSFMEFLLDKGREYSNNLPIRRSAYDAMIKDAMEPCFACDEEGNVIKDENGMPVPAPRGIYYWEDFEYPLSETTKEEADALEALINQIDGIKDFDSQLYQIIQEEAAPFFEGQKTVEEAARIIQGRAEILVKESMN